MSLFSSTCSVLLAFATVGMCVDLLAQTKPGSDVLIFKDGEKLIGELKSATGDKVVFKSDIGFEVTVPWAKIQELHSDKKFAAIHKDVILRNDSDAAKVPVGSVEMKDQKLEVVAAPQPNILPVQELANVVSQQSFNRALERRNILGGWKGGADFGMSLTEATVTTRDWTGAINLARQDTSESWLPVRNQTSFGFNLFNEITKSPNNSGTRTTIIHSDFVHDMYFRPRLFGFVGATFDHNHAQGLLLLQGYGGGIGVVAYKTPASELDIRAGLGYMRQTYTDPTLNRNLIGSRFNENYSHTFSRGISFYEQAGIRPAWNSMKNYFAGFLAGLNVPVYKRMSLNVSSYDSYVNNPPPFRKKNTLQLTVGLHVTLFK